MSAPKSSGRKPPAPILTFKSHQTVASPSTDTPPSGKSDNAGAWETIPGLGGGSAVKPQTPNWPSSAWAGVGELPRKTPGEAPKTAGAAPTDWQSFMDKGSATTTKSAASAVVAASASVSTSRPFPGLSTTSHSSVGAAGIKHEQTEAYHASNSPAAALGLNASVAPTAHNARPVDPPHTAPLPQTGFQAFSDGATSEKDDSSTGAFTDAATSESSVGISEHYLQQHPELAQVEAPTWIEATHPRSIQNAMLDPNVQWDDPYPGSVQRLIGLNPPRYVMPFGTRVVNIKTDFPSNILASLHSGRYSTMEKVSDRIMTIYKARVDPREKVVFLFSVNGSKKFCGLAEMCGDWEPTDPIEGWQENAESAKSHGTIPVTWIYCKDVPYFNFDHIRQIHNGHPVGNMWNGMNFPSDIGRQVIEVYVTTASHSSSLGFPRNYPENDGMPSLRPNNHLDTRSFRPNFTQRGRGNFAPRGSVRGGRGMPRGNFNVPNWRAQGSEGSSAGGQEPEDDHTPTPASTGGRNAGQSNAAPTFSMEDLRDAPLASNTTLSPGEPVSFLMGDDGRLMAVPASGERPNAQAFRPSPLSRSAISGMGTVRDDRVPPVNSASPHATMGREGHGGLAHSGLDRSSHDYSSQWQLAAAARTERPRIMSLAGPSTAAMRHQATMFAAQQQAYDRNHRSHVPDERAWDRHTQQMATLGFQSNAAFRPGASTNHAAHARHDHGDNYDEMPTPTHRPAPRRESSGAEPIPSYLSVPGWHSQVIRGMGELQLKALFFTLSADQHILEYLSMEPNLPDHRANVLQARIRHAEERKREVAEELNYTGYINFQHPIASEDLGSSDHDFMRGGPSAGAHGQWALRQTISPVRDEFGRPLPSASEGASSSPPDVFGMQYHRPQGTHQHQPSMQSLASMGGGGVQLR